MVSSQLLVPLTILLISDGAVQAKRELSCAYSRWPEFCRFIENVYQQNSKAVKFMRGDTFKDDRDRISNIINIILRAVKVEKKPELLKALQNALDSQWNALFQLKVHCSGKEKRTTPCRKGLYLLAYGVYYLVYVLEYLADGLQKNAIKEAFNAFEKGMNETGDYTELILVMGKAASTALDSSMQ